LAVAHAIIWSGVRIETAPTRVESRPFEVLGGIRRVLVYCRDPLARKSQELVNRGEIVVFVVVAVAVGGVVMAACDAHNRLARLISVILSHRTLSSDDIAFLLKCKVTASMLGRCDGRLGLLVAPEYFVCFVVR
jgi:hypothetical protein